MVVPEHIKNLAGFIPRSPSPGVGTISVCQVIGCAYRRSRAMNRTLIISSLCALSLLLPASELHADDSRTGQGVVWNLPSHWIAPFGHHPLRVTYDRRMILAARIASSRASCKPTWRCWHFVKDALVDAGVVATRPESPWAKQAGEELCGKFGFRKLPVTDPRDAPVGAVLVYGGADAGHVEMRTDSGYASDFISPTPYPRPLIGVYVKGV